MENWIGAYRLPPNLGLGVDRGPETPEGGGGVSPIPGSTPSPGLINMWNNAIKVENQNQQHGLNATGSIKGKGRIVLENHRDSQTFFLLLHYIFVCLKCLLLLTIFIFLYIIHENKN